MKTTLQQYTDDTNTRGNTQNTDTGTSTDTAPDPSTSSSEVQPYTYTATLYTPLFYSSKEGTVIETDPGVSATALMHAIGYDYYDLEKRFLLTGDDSTTPDYSHLTELPFFVSEMMPVNDCTVDERTFRTMSYTSEATIVSSDEAVGKYITGSKNAIPRKIDGSNAGWHQKREYIGIPPGVEFSFTIWAPPSDAPPEEFGFRAGIKKTGEINAVRDDVVAETVTLNQFLLQSTYVVPENVMYNVMDAATDYVRGNDVRTNRFIDVDREFADSLINTNVMQ